MSNWVKYVMSVTWNGPRVFCVYLFIYSLPAAVRGRVGTSRLYVGLGALV